MRIITQTSRMIIRLFSAEEEEMYLSLYNDERVMEYLPYRSREEHIDIFREHLTDSGSVTGRWGIFNRDDGDFAGMCLLRLFDDGSDWIELGYALRYDYWGKGMATEMAVALLMHMSVLAPHTRFVAVTDLNNVPSQRVLEKAGMQRDGNYLRHGEDLALFRLHFDR